MRKCSVFSSILLKKTIACETSDLHGVFSTLYHRSIEIFNSSLTFTETPKQKGDVYNVFSPISNQNWVSTWDSECAILQAHFKNIKVYTIAYKLQSEDTNPGNAHPSNWQFWGSLDNETWTLLDEKSDNHDLNGHLIIKEYPVFTIGEYSHFKLEQTGIGHNQAHLNAFAILKIDVMGQLIPIIFGQTKAASFDFYYGQLFILVIL